MGIISELRASAWTSLDNDKSSDRGSFMRMSPPSSGRIKTVRIVFLLQQISIMVQKMTPSAAANI